MFRFKKRMHLFTFVVLLAVLMARTASGQGRGRARGAVRIGDGGRGRGVGGRAAGPGRASGIKASRLEIQRRKTISVGPSLQTLHEHLDIATGHTVSRLLAA